ncbi:oryzalexin E synthase-like [Selaginella moellendorffii]|uniref:oryzalexin E synthase-like n=1 Tax=Selaginella moellendorffii TaxID=88036 RepID=UPI000D1CC6BE|nr:oryzalexin E synthase-like [Selaginella moellendorffii]|eukprot:XP_024545455.1 oryzalexin E synthase-like [Selaginella moellendorffii]
MAKSIKAIHHAPVNLTDAVGKFISDAFCMILFGSTDERVLDLVAQIEKQTLNVNTGNLFPALDFLDLHGDILVAGVDTIKWTAVWAMAEVLRNSRVMENAQEEWELLAFLTTIHPRQHSHIPKHCTVLINIWAIGHDPRHWDEPEVFRPEGFLGDQEKSNQELMMPFSAGRRTCPGMPIASRVVPFVVASLLHAFDWKSDGEIDLSEKSGTLSCMPVSDSVAFASARLETSAYA